MNILIPIIIALFILLFFILIILVIRNSRGKTRNQRAETILLPDHLGIKKDTPYSTSYYELKDTLEQSLDPVYMLNVKKRVLEKQPWTEKRYAIYLHGLKQYFLLNSVLKEVPMFSDEVDVIWHEMILFTREYDDFCQKFYGETLQHIPNLAKGTNPNARPEFEWLYTQFFEVDVSATYIYNDFYKKKFTKDFLDKLNALEASDLIEQYFKKDSLSLKVAGTLAPYMKEQITLSQKMLLSPGKKSENQDSDSNFLFFVPGVFDSDSDSHHKGGHHHHDHSSHHSSADSSNDSSSSCSGSSCGGSCGSS